MLECLSLYFEVAYQWLQLMHLYLRYRSLRGSPVGPHVTNAIMSAHRSYFDLYMTLFQYYANFEEGEFYKMFRMSVTNFNKLHDIVGPSLTKTSSPISTQLRLAITLNFLAHGDRNRSTCNFVRVDSRTAHKIIAEVCPLIWDQLSPIYLRWKSPVEWRIVGYFSRVKWNMANCVGALGGKDIRIKCPPNSGRLFFNSKQFYSFKLLAASDACYRFTWVDIGSYGSNSDVSAFQHTDLFHALENEEAILPEATSLPRSNIFYPHFLIADETFPLKNYLMKPFARHNLTDRQKLFNNRLLRGRNSLDDAFGIMSRNWQILKNRLVFTLQTSTDIVKAIVCLHNFAINEELMGNIASRYAVPPEHRRQRETLFDDQEVASENVLRQREILADYFISDFNSRQGAII